MQVATIQQINSSIMFGNFTNDQLDSVISAIKYARSQLGKSMKQGLRVGDQVEFYSSKRGITVTGTVSKIAIKYITVNSASGLWKVPANMLKVVE